MVTRIRRVGLLWGTLALVLMTTGLADVAYAQNFIQCPEGGTGPYGICYGTNKNDVMNGTAGDDYMGAGRGADIMYGRRGTDRLYGFQGPDIAYGGPGSDDLYSECDYEDSDCGKDEKHGGPGNDYFSGSLQSDRYFGGARRRSDVGSQLAQEPRHVRVAPGTIASITTRG